MGYRRSLARHPRGFASLAFLFADVPRATHEVLSVNWQGVAAVGARGRPYTEDAPLGAASGDEIGGAGQNLSRCGHEQLSGRGAKKFPVGARNQPGRGRGSRGRGSQAFERCRRAPFIPTTRGALALRVRLRHAGARPAGGAVGAGRLTVAAVGAVGREVHAEERPRVPTVELLVAARGRALAHHAAVAALAGVEAPAAVERAVRGVAAADVAAEGLAQRAGLGPVRGRWDPVRVGVEGGVGLGFPPAGARVGAGWGLAHSSRAPRGPASDHQGEEEARGCRPSPHCAGPFTVARPRLLDLPVDRRSPRTIASHLDRV